MNGSRCAKYKIVSIGGDSLDTETACMTGDVNTDEATVIEMKIGLGFHELKEQESWQVDFRDVFAG